MKSRQSEDTQLYVNLKTCCAVAYLQSRFGNDFNSLIKEEKVFKDIIRARNQLRYINKPLEDLTVEFSRKIAGISKDVNKKFSDEFCNELSGFILSDIIDEDYRQYFYSYPKESYIKSIEESELEELLLYNESEKITDEDLSRIINKSLDRGGRVIDTAIAYLRDVSKNIPTFIIRNERLLVYCFSQYSLEVIKMMEQNFLWDSDNYQKTVAALSTINSYSFSKKHELFTLYSNKISATVATLGKDALACRLKVIQTFGDDIVDFVNIFHASGSPCLTEEEIQAINKEDILFALLDENKVTAQLIVALSNKINNPLAEKNYKKIINIFAKYCDVNSSTVTIATSIINILNINKTCNNKLFDYALKSVDSGSFLIDYLNNVGEIITAEYCKAIERIELIGNFKEYVLEALYNNKSYLIYLKNAIFNNKLSDKEYDINIFNKDIVKRLFDTTPELFLKYRLSLLNQRTEIKKSYKFVYASSYPFVTKDEMKLMTCSDLITLVDLNTALVNSEPFIALIKSVVKSVDDTYEVATYLLGSKDSQALEIF